MDENDFKRIIVIGDLHGYYEPLAELLEKIKVEEEDLVIFIGDYIDRGPESKLVVDKLMELKFLYKNIIFLKGNHEDMLLGSMGFTAVVQDLNTWLYNGGARTLKSYGVRIDEIGNLIRTWNPTEHGRLMREYFPEGHLDFFLDLGLYVETQNYFFCHAGISPKSTIGEGKRNTFDLLWMRDHIYAENPPWEKTVVCGHTPLSDVLITEKLICIDTGLYYYGRLSAIDVLTKKVFHTMIL